MLDDNNYLKNQYNSFFKKRTSVKINKVILPYEHWFSSYINLNDKRVLDFGSNIDSLFYKRCKRSQNVIYYGYDVDEETVKWLLDNEYYYDFWNNDLLKFDLINASQVYEHLTVSERIEFIKRCKFLLKPSGILLLDFPFIENLNGLRFWHDLTHKPVSSKDDVMLVKNHGFGEVETFLVGSPPFNFFLYLVNILLFGNWQQTQQIVAYKESKVKSTFNNIAVSWEKHLPKSLDIIPFTLFDNVSGMTILEAGCGEGNLCRFLKNKGNKVYGIDVSENLINFARKYNDDIHYVVGDVRKLPFSDNLFDLVYSGGVIEHFDGTEEAIAEMFRVTKHGGSLLIGVPNILSFEFPVVWVLQKLNMYNLGYEKAYTYEWLKTQCEINGGTDCERISVHAIQDLSTYTFAKKFVLTIIRVLDYIPYKLGFGGFFFYIRCKKI